MALPIGHVLHYRNSTCMQLVKQHFLYNKVLPPNYSYTLKIEINRARDPS